LKKTIYLFATIFLSSLKSFSQGAPACPSITPGSANVSICQGTCTTLTSTIVSNNQTSSYTVSAIPYVPYPYTGAPILVGADDVWSSPVDLGFNFCFFGQSYKKAILGDNGQLCFDTSFAKGYDNFLITTALPNNVDLPAPTICAAFRDIDQGIGGHSYIHTVGSAPCRALVMSWVNVPLYNNGQGLHCTGTPNSTLQVVLYENTNYIDVYIQNSYSCSDWNGGYGIIGIQDANTNSFVCPPNRNFPNTWTTTNEAWRFAPAGPPSYAITWTGPGGVVVGTGPSVSVCPASTSTYTASMVVTNCDGAKTTYTGSETVTVNSISPVTVSPVSSLICNSGGSATLTAANAGVYSWSPSATLNSSSGAVVTATPLSTTTYTVTGTSGACTTTATTIVKVGLPATLTSSKTNILCKGGASGTAKVTPAGGTAPYTYSWTPGGSTIANLTGLSAGNYTATVTTAIGCQTTAAFTLTEPPALVMAPFSTNSTCGLANGNATANASGGTGSYTYTWTPAPGSGQGTAVAGNLAATNYTIVVNDANNCTQSGAISVANTPGPTLSLSSATNLLCNAACTGSATVTGSGGEGAYTFSWTGNPSLSATANALCAGSYTCTIKDANGCPATQTVAITQPPAMGLSPSAISATCGLSNGSASVAVTGGTGAYTYSWNPIPGVGQGTANASSLAANTYTIHVSDANGCNQSKPIAVNNTGGPSASLASVVNPTCFSGCTGSANVSASGGTGLYTYSWSGNASTSSFANALCSGTYTCTIKDANGCQITQTATVTQPTALTLTQASLAATCGAANGTASVSVSGGTGSYTYSWNPSPGSGQGTAAVSGLTSNTYTVLVTDANACSQSKTVVISNVSGPSASLASSVNPACFSTCTGSASVTATGGTGPYTYTWTGNPSTGATASLLCSGTYTCTIKDANGCQTSQSVTLGQPSTLTLSATSASSTCGASNGSASVLVSGGTGAYTYSWSPTPGSGQGTSSVTGLAANTYTAVITDANGCSKNSTVTITSLGGPTVTLAASANALCHASCNGNATVNATGGSTPYSYTWSGSASSGPTATGLCAGTYTCSIRDIHSCLTTQTVTITEPGALAVLSGNTSASCGASNGSAYVQVSGGTGAYTYSWNPSPGGGQGRDTASGLVANTYTVLVKDANGCPLTSVISVNNLGGPTTTIASLLTPSCNTLCNGTATISPSGGTGAYSYSWSGNPSITSTANGLCSGTFTCTVSDANGCKSTQTVVLTQPPALTISSISSNANCNGSCDGSAVAVPAGGTGQYTYSWSSGAGNVSTANSLCQGTYTCQVKDANGCLALQTYSISQPLPMVASVTSTKVSCNGSCNGIASVNPSGGTGGYIYSWFPATGSAPAINSICSGTYTCTISDSKNCQLVQTVTVGTPVTLTAVGISLASTCKLNNGSLSVQPSGGTPVYTYSWSPAPAAGQNTSTASALPPNLYTCIITDSSGCKATFTDSVKNTGIAPVAKLTATGSTIFCAGKTVPLTASGGTTYSWNTGAQSDTISAKSGGIYTVYVKNGCGIDSAKIALTKDSLPKSTVSGQNKLCNGDSELLAASGGTSYMWNTGATNPTIQVSQAGIYQVAVTNHCGTDTAIFTLIVNNVTAYFTANGTTGIVPFPVNFTDSSSANAVSWHWDFGDGTTLNGFSPNHTFASTGTFVVVLTVTEPNGCTNSFTRIIVVNEIPSWILVPNVFTPNGDGSNDYFLVKSIGLSEFEAKIYDRWGVEMAVLTTPDMGWDGRTIGGQMAVNGTYYYLIKAKGADKVVYNLTGFVMLIRN
jgi:gliding motility-associated-like protein